VTVWAEATTLGDLLLRAAQRRPDHEALVFPHARHTYADVAARSIHAARGLAALGVQLGDRVGLLMPNCPDFVFAFFGAQLLGAIVVPINTRFRVRELSYVVENADLVAVVTCDIVDEHVDYVERLSESLPGLSEAPDPEHLALPAAPLLRTVVLLGDSEPAGLVSRSRFDELAATVSEDSVLARRAGVRVRDIALMPFTSGTTADPKGCLLTHESLFRVWVSAADRLRVTPDDRVFDPLPLFHMSCLGPLIFSSHLGATLISMTHFEPGEALDMIEAERASWLYTVFPPITMGLITHPTFGDRDLSEVRATLNVAPDETLAIMQRAFEPAVLVNGHFGMTEASGAITCNEWDAPPEIRLGTTGKTLPGIELRVVDPETGAIVAPGTPGELQLRGPGLFEGYHKDPAKTAAALPPDGWLRSGDRGFMDAEGNVSYTGRIKDMLKVGGENVAPSEIESHLSTHPAVKLVQVVGVSDARLDEVPAAFIELVEGRELTAEAAIEFCVGQIASFKVPRHVRFVTDWPMSATKIQKFRLREALEEELGAG
jgi:fatty-acyl-CoA synthase/long-chain acyl-CoA synthetase